MVWVWDLVFPDLRKLCTLDKPSCREKIIISLIITIRLIAIKMEKVMTMIEYDIDDTSTGLLSVIFAQ